VTTLLLFAVPFAAWLIAARILPNRTTGWLDLVPGATLVAVGLQAMNLFTAYFLGPKLTSATQFYGVFGIVTTILFWFYITGRLIIASATLNAPSLSSGITLPASESPGRSFPRLLESRS
jgi:uncharacterized BrkB/YihY/UPF0761 family membrane protein